MASSTPTRPPRPLGCRAPNRLHPADDLSKRGPSENRKVPASRFERGTTSSWPLRILAIRRPSRTVRRVTTAGILGAYIPSERKRGLRRETSGPSASTPPGLPAPLRGEGREYKAYPSLSRARWLFPAGRPGVRRAGMRGLFHPSSLKGRALRASILAGALPGRRVSLRRDALVGLEDEFAQALYEPGVIIAFYLGVPGAYRKVTAQVMTPNGKVLAFAKISNAPTTWDLIEKERRVLMRLFSESEGLRGRIPEVLHAFDWE